MTTVTSPHQTTTHAPRKPVLRYIAGTVTIIVGIVFIAATFINNLFAVGPAFEDMIDDFRPVLTDESLATANADIDALEAAGAEFQSTVAPAMAKALGMTPEQFSTMVQTNYPAVAQGMAALPEITTTFSGLVDTLDSQQELFASADAIPTDNLPATTVPWIITISGILAIAAGALLLMPGRIGSIFAIVLGGLLLIVTFALGLPQKAADADQLNENLQPIYTQQLIDGASTALNTVAAMGDEMQNAMLPDLGQQLGMDQEQLNAFLGQNFPATASAMQNMPASLERFSGFVETFSTNLDNYETIQPVSFSPIIWMMVIGGAIVLIAGGVCLAFYR
jgi:hypothetical protein